MNFVYTHAQRSQATQIVQDFTQMVTTRYSHTIKFLRTDGDTALGNDFKRAMAQQGITVERSAPYTPAQNGQAERAGRTISTVARCLRIYANLPLNIWPETAKTAGYLLNRAPTRQLGWKTPFEALHGRKPDLSHLHIYGCKSFYLLHKIPRKDKLLPRAHIGYLVGYDSTNIFRIWRPDKSRVIRVRDVKFDDESTF